MDIVVIVLLVILTIFLVVAEVLLLPGLTVAAIGAFLAGTYAAYLTYLEAGMGVAIIVFLGILAISILTVYICVKQRNISKISLKVNSDSVVLPNVRTIAKIGDTGIAVSRLAPMGTVRIGEINLEAKSRSGFIDPKMCVIIVGYEDNSVIVEKN